MNKKIGVLGCGWLGLPLAKALVSNGNNVHGSTTSAEKKSVLKKARIVPFLIRLSEKKIDGNISEFLEGITILIINVPPKLRGKNPENYVKKMHLVLEEVKKTGLQKIIFVSSTAVYGNSDGIVTEETPTKPNTESGKQLLVSEDLFGNEQNFDTTIVRFGGLIGPNRHPITILSQKKELSNGNVPVNLIHLDDCIGIITSIIEGKWWNETFNAVYPLHPTKMEYYTAEAIKRGLSFPNYTSDKVQNGKIIASQRLTNVKNYRFVTSIVG